MKNFLKFGLKFASVVAFCTFALLNTRAVQAAAISNDRVDLVRYNPSATDVLKRGQTLKFFVWNVHKYTDEQAERTVAYMSKVADFVFIEESMMGGEFEKFYRSLKAMTWLSALSFSTDPAVFTGVTTGTHFTISNSFGVRSTAREPITVTAKMIVVTELPIEGTKETLLVANIHGINFVNNYDYATQLMQVQEILLAHKGPIVFGGDFNMWSLDRALMLHRLATNVGLDYVPLADDHRTLMLDQMFTRGLIVKSARVMVDLEGSDHLPLWAELIL